MKLTLVTGNKKKFQSAKLYFDKLNVKFDHQSLDIIEPQDSNISNIATHKAKQAYKQIESPILISDTGWKIPALNGFPGPFMHYITEWLDNETFQNMLKDKKDRTIIMENVLVFKDINILKHFKIVRKGLIIEAPKGIANWNDQIITFRKDKKTIAQCLNNNLDIFDSNKTESIWQTFAKWYKNEYTK